MMTDEAAESRGPATMGDADTSRSADAQPPADGFPAADGSPGDGPPRVDREPRGAGSTAAGPAPAAARLGGRSALSRPRQGRYLAGVCAAIGRATNTDPVLWRVLLAVLGFFGGIGVLVYLAAWLIIPAEGDTGSPVEAMLGRGRSSMSPMTVLALGVLVALMFGFIVTDTFRAALLGAAILVAGALLVNRNSGGARTAAVAADGPAPQPPGPPPPGFPPPAASEPAGVQAPAPPVSAASPAGPDAGETTATLPVPPAAPPLPPSAAPLPPSPGGYRPPFAPHGPYVSSDPYPPVSAPPVARPPKPPRERSRLGAATFSLLLVAIGVVAAVDLAGVVPVWPSAYFAAGLVVIALGLLVGAWFGRARWLIALGILASIGLGVSTTAESWTEVSTGGDAEWRPSDVTSLADRYQTRFGEASLDLRQVDFTGQDRQVTVKVEVGAIEVLLPPNVDVAARVDLGAGGAEVFSESWEGVRQPSREISDLGVDGAGGGKLRLFVQLNAGDVEVHR